MKKRPLRKITWTLLMCFFAVMPFFLTACFNFGQDRIVSSDLPKDVSDAKPMDDTIYVGRYVPFSKGNALVEIKEPTLKIASDHPKLDGATALYPVYAAAVQAIYQGVAREDLRRMVNVSSTPRAYQRLEDGEADVIFCAQPSPEQIEKAKAKGIEFQLTPLGREAFVFFVNKANRVETLTNDQIVAIYKKQIVNWSEVGGTNKTILPFQRPKNSGSQTAMEQLVMRGEPLAPPLEEERHLFMGGIVRAAAAYRNADNAIGYSFRFFVTKMTGTKGIKLLKINGVAPSVETVRNDTYPYTGNLYAVTTNKTANKPHVQELIAWFQSPQGQKLIEDAGYISIKSK